MRVLNTKDYKKKYSKFSLPGFRSGSVLKKIVACMYYFFVLVFAVNSIRLTVTGEFGGAHDILLAVVVEILIILILLVPVIAIGFSDHYDWHGIKLFLIILVSWCVLFTAAQFVSTLFSDEFIKSTNVYSENDGDVSSNSGGETGELTTDIDKDIIKDNIDEINNSSSTENK